MIKLQKALTNLDHPLTFWWRDDDLTKPTPQGDKMLALAQEFTIPLHVAVIPTLLCESLITWLPESVIVLQHGIAHENKASLGMKKCELTKDCSIEQLFEGQEQLKSLFGKRYYSMLVPPWNRIDPVVVTTIKDHYKAISTFYRDTNRYDLPNVKTHLDLIDWDTRDVKSPDQLEHELIQVLHQPGPIGLLTHHLVHSPGCWASLYDLFKALTESQNVHFVSPTSLHNGGHPPLQGSPNEYSGLDL